MKKYTILFLFVSLLFISCEDVVDVNLDIAPPRLVVEASINWLEGTNGNEQIIKLSTTTGYFSNTIPKVSGAIVYITNSTSQQFDFVEETELGIYKCNNFIPVINEEYTLTVVYLNQIYTSTEKLLDTPLVTRVEQDNEGGIIGDEIEVKFFFDDLQNETNFYLLKIDDPYKVIPEYGVIEDRFFQNNEMFGLYFSEELVSGDELKFTLKGISENYFNYMNILLAQTGSAGAGPFSTPTSTVRGNVVNQTEFDNFALGYFRLSKMEVVDYTIE